MDIDQLLTEFVKVASYDFAIKLCENERL
jgi:hypothetical protein